MALNAFLSEANWCEVPVLTKIANVFLFLSQNFTIFVILGWLSSFVDAPVIKPWESAYDYK